MSEELDINELWSLMEDIVDACNEGKINRYEALSNLKHVVDSEISCTEEYLNKCKMQLDITT